MQITKKVAEQIREAARNVVDFSVDYCKSIDAWDIPEAVADEVIRNIETIGELDYHRAIACEVIKELNNPPQGSIIMLKRHFELAY